MEISYFSSRHPVLQLMMAVFILLLSYLVISILSMVPALMIFGISLSDLMNGIDFSDAKNIPFLKYLQIVQAFSLFILPPILIGWMDRRNPWNFLHVDRNPESGKAGQVLLILICLLPFLNLLSMLNQEFRLPGFLAGIEEWMQETEARAGDLTSAFLKVTTLGGFLVNVLMVALLPAFGEEFLFRGVFQKLLYRWFKNPHWAIWTAAFVFSAFHLQFYGFLPRLILGVLFGYLFFWSGNLWYAIIAHFINNFIPVTATFLFPEQFNPDELTTMGQGPAVWLWAIPGTLVAAGLLYYFYSKTRLQSNP